MTAKKKTIEVGLLIPGDQFEDVASCRTFTITSKNGRMIEVQDAAGKLWAWPSKAKAIPYGHKQ